MGIGRIIGSGFQVKRWFGYEHIKRDGSAVKNIIKDTISLGKVGKKTKVTEDFAACMVRYNMTEADLKRRMGVSLRLAGLFALFGTGLFIYMIYLLFIGHILATLICLSLTMFVLARAYREHFNYFQMRQRRLGCTFKEWINFTFGGQSKQTKSRQIKPKN